jgi:exopolysaccharide production protein ExoQ
MRADAVERLAVVPRHPRRAALAGAAALSGAGMETAFVVLAMLVLTGGAVGMLTNESRYAVDLAAGDPLRQTLYAVIYAGVAALAALRWRAMLAVLRNDALLTGLLLLATASIIWSVAPDITLRRVIALWGTTLVGVYLAARFPVRVQLRLLAWTLGIAAMASLAVVLVMPGYGLSSEHHVGAWRGIFTHKQTLGRYMVLGALAFLLLARGGRRTAWLGAALCAALLVLSTSATAIVVAAALLVLLPLANWARTRSPASLLMLAGAAAVLGIAALLGLEYREALVQMVGKDPTLTGRTDVWSAVLRVLPERLWLGWGFGAFWLGWASDSAAVWDAVGWTPPHAHNGVLDLWLNLGVAGVAAFSAALVLLFARAVRWLRSTPGAEGLWPILFLVFFILYNVPSRLILQTNDLIWVVYVALAFSLARRPATGRGDPASPEGSHA